MYVNKPQDISPAEWREIMQIQEVAESWGLSDETPEEFAASVYAVKFDFVSGSPGYVGDLYIIQGDVLTGDAPFVLARNDGALRVVN
jgi:hypothetical protein